MMRACVPPKVNGAARRATKLVCSSGCTSITCSQERKIDGQRERGLKPSRDDGSAQGRGLVDLHWFSSRRGQNAPIIRLDAGGVLELLREERHDVVEFFGRDAVPHAGINAAAESCVFG